MKKLLGGVALSLCLAAPAMAADMPVKAAPPTAVAVVYGWTGWYAGLNVGYGWGREKFRDVREFDNTGVVFSYADFKYTSKGWLAGVQYGYNWQSGQFVFGWESDFQFSDVNGNIRFNNAIFSSPSATFHTDVSSELKYFGTLRLRGGYLLTPAVLAYVTGGFAYGRIESTLAFPSSATGVTAIGLSATDKRWHTGYSAGGGLEGKLTDRLTWKAEYLYVHLGSKGHRIGPIANDFYTWNQSMDLHVARVGLNVQFYSAAPVVARY